MLLSHLIWRQKNVVNKATLIRNQQNNNKKATRAIVITGIVIAFFVLFLCVGYAAFESSLFVDSFDVSVQVDQDVRITNVVASTSENGGISSSTDYGVDYLLTSFSLPNDTSTVMYEVTVKNFGNTEVAITDISLPEALQGILDLEIIDYTIGNVITDNAETCVDSVDGCKLDIMRTFYVKVKYLTGAYDGTNTTFNNTVIQFTFGEPAVPQFNVTYDGMTNPGSWPTTVNEGSDLVINFGDVNLMVLSVKVGSTVFYAGSYDFTDNVLTVPGITGDVEVNILATTDVEYVIDPAHPDISMNISVGKIDDSFYQEAGFHAANAMSDTIKDITVTFTFTSSSKKAQVIDGSIYVDGELNQTKQISFSSSTKSPLAITFENVNVATNSVIELRYAANNVNNGKVNISNQAITFTFAS